MTVACSFYKIVYSIDIRYWHSFTDSPGPFLDLLDHFRSSHRYPTSQLPHSTGTQTHSYPTRQLPPSLGPNAFSIRQVRRPINSQGPLALSIHQCRRPYQLIRPAGIHSQGLQALTIHQVRWPYQFTRSTGLVNSPGPQALSMHRCRRP